MRDALMLFAVALAIVSIVGIAVFLTASTAPRCLKSHVEQQWEMPLAIVVGGGQYGGGIALPAGNATLVEVTVCDEWEGQ